MVALAASEAQIGVADIHGGKIGFVIDHVVHQIGGFNQTFIVFQHLLVIARIQQHLLNAAGGQQQVRSILHISDNIVQILVRQRQQIFGQLYHFAVHHLGKAGIGDHTEKRHGEYQQQSNQNGKFTGDGLLAELKHKSLQEKTKRELTGSRLDNSLITTLRRLFLYCASGHSGDNPLVEKKIDDE